MNADNDEINQVLIVGGGLAGASAAEELRKADYTGDITILAGEDHAPYDRPPLSKEVMLGKKAADETALHPEPWYAENNIELLTGSEVTALNLKERQVTAGDTVLTYDRLLIATGSHARHLPVIGESGADVRYLRTCEDAAALKKRLGGRLLFIGGGWIGLELAAAARSAGGSVVLTETAPLPLANILGTQVAEVFVNLHRSNGVDIRTETTVQALKQGAEGTVVTFSDGSEVTVDTIVVGIGAVPNTALAEAAGFSCSNGIDVNARLRTDDPYVYAAGDVANHDHPTLGRMRVEHWDNAQAQGRHAARSLLGDEEPYSGQPYFFTDQYDLGMEYVGHANGDDEVQIHGDLDSRVFRAYWTREGTVVAGMHCGDWDAIDEIRSLVGGPSSALPH